MNTIRTGALTIAIAAGLGASAQGVGTAMESGIAERTSPAGGRVLTDADMQPIDSLKDNDDYSAFMGPGVSESLRLQALRRLFHSATFNRSDGLANYADDYSFLAKASARLVDLSEPIASSTMR